ncbi:hypothetical protein BRPE64_ACDS08220 [Caballeronia insecticola]|uniref:Uncharacterized protein n=1 Tax=Caballeronia insecticola TaxID=758793 RepID=R4WUI5_9BURK|nr:hypothetical protein BRPE64_ACDS08220 [Caballeronia insecticola]
MLPCRPAAARFPRRHPEKRGILPEPGPRAVGDAHARDYMHQQNDVVPPCALF